ncbi:MAG TPA: hypothetical protein VE961_09145 [Pyrinomonadaceae bacterium]|nr:hypothetical protein [Pyrinomonadaceae bacterium]
MLRDSEVTSLLTAIVLRFDFVARITRIEGSMYPGMAQRKKASLTLAHVSKWSHGSTQ